MHPSRQRPRHPRRSTVNRAWRVALAAAVLPACARPTIDRADVERVISTLAADSMEGRRAFTPGAAKAAAFIQAEFRDIGLEPFGRLRGYLQPFPVYAVGEPNGTVVLNGRVVPPDQVVFGLTTPDVHLRSGDSTQVATIGPDDQPTPALRAAFNGGNTLVLISPSQRAAFDRVKRFTAVRGHTLDPSGGANAIFVLTSEQRARSFRIDVMAAVDTARGANVVGMIPGHRRDEIVLFSAHYDHLGVLPAVNGDSIANGANDDASGVTAVIELARYFKARGTPERTLLFAAFTAEELGGFGSQYFSQRLDPAHIVAMFNIEMIGKPSTWGANAAWITGFDRSSFGSILQQAVEGTEFSFHPDPYPTENLFLRSDNATLARLGVPAHSISTTPIDVDADYHQVSDEVRTLDLDHVTNTIRAISRGAETIISGAATPTRVEAMPRPN